MGFLKKKKKKVADTQSNSLRGQIPASCESFVKFSRVTRESFGPSIIKVARIHLHSYNYTLIR